MTHVQLVLPADTARKMTTLRQTGDLVRVIQDAVDRAVIRLADYPQLADLAWNRTEEYVPAREAFQLYELNWRFIEKEKLTPAESSLLMRLMEQFGAGVINA